MPLQYNIDMSAGKARDILHATRCKTGFLARGEGMQLQCLHYNLAIVRKRNANNLFAPLQPDELS